MRERKKEYKLKVDGTLTTFTFPHYELANRYRDLIRQQYAKGIPIVVVERDVAEWREVKNEQQKNN